MRSFALFFTLLLISWTASARDVLRIQVNGAINPPIAEHIHDGIQKAEKESAHLILIELDTPGGLLDSTRGIISGILNTPIPVVVYVTPRGARATSAGVFLMMASDIAAMSPQTHLGAAHPVSLMGGEKAEGKENGKSVMEEKAVPDSAAYIRVLAFSKGRNADWAEKAVRASVSLTSEEALKNNVIDLVAADREELFKRLDGRKIKKNDAPITLNLKDVKVVDFPMSMMRRLLHVIANPNLAYLLLMIGIYGLIYEFSSPGIGFGAIVGVVALILAGYALQILPVNYAGLLLLGLGILLTALEMQIPSHGLLMIGGLILLALGAFFLFDATGPYFRVSLEVIGGTVLSTGLFFGFVVRKAFAARRIKPTTGVDLLVGQAAEVHQAIDPHGMIYINGELWTAEADQRIESGARVRILRIVGNTAHVEKI